MTEREATPEQVVRAAPGRRRHLSRNLRDQALAVQIFGRVPGGEDMQRPCQQAANARCRKKLVWREVPSPGRGCTEEPRGSRQARAMKGLVGSQRTLEFCSSKRISAGGRQARARRSGPPDHLAHSEDMVRVFKTEGRPRLVLGNPPPELLPHAWPGLGDTWYHPPNPEETHRVPHFQDEETEKDEDCAQRDTRHAPPCANRKAWFTHGTRSRDPDPPS